MIKRLKPLLILASSAVVLGIALWVLVAFVLPKDEAGEDKGNAVVLMNENLTEAEFIDIKNSFDEYKLVKSAIGKYYIEGKKDYPVNSAGVVALLEQIGSLTAVKKVIDQPSKNQLKDYGLNEGSTFTVTDEGLVYRFCIGGTSASGNYYFQKEGDEAVYLIDASLPDILLLSRHQFYTDTLTAYSDSIAEQGELTNIVVESKNREETIRIKFNDELEEDEAGVTYMMTAPIKHAVSFAMVDEIAALLTDLSNSSIVGDDTTKAGLKKFGLDQPTSTLTVTISGKKEIFHFGRVNESEMQYCYREGGKFVHAVSASAAALLEAPLLDFCEDMIYTRAADELSGIEVKGKDKTYTIHIGDKDEAGNMAVEINNRRVDSELFSDFYMHILNIAITGIDEKPKDKTPYVSVKFTLTDGTVETMEFYPVSDLKCCCRLNGEGRFLVNTQYVDLILENAQHLYNGETIELEW